MTTVLLLSFFLSTICLQVISVMLF
uniref:Uncharacterized protein n=1 Tax=Anguilla anguilla TaxID=7936 RepID=A0A0E9XYX5_ANGAN